MIIGIGSDIVDIRRIDKTISKFGNKFIKRCFTDTEITKSESVNKRINSYAKRFAAKEAFVKAIGEGFRNNINYRDIDVTNDNKGKPIINISINIKNFLKKKFNLNKYKIFLSLSDEKKHSIAYVIINKKND